MHSISAYPNTSGTGPSKNITELVQQEKDQGHSSLRALHAVPCHHVQGRPGHHPCRAGHHPCRCEIRPCPLAQACSLRDHRHLLAIKACYTQKDAPGAVKITQHASMTSKYLTTPRSRGPTTTAHSPHIATAPRCLILLVRSKVTTIFSKNQKNIAVDLHRTISHLITSLATLPFLLLLLWFLFPVGACLRRNYGGIQYQAPLSNSGAKNRSEHQQKLTLKLFFELLKRKIFVFTTRLQRLQDCHLRHESCLLDCQPQHKW